MQPPGLRPPRRHSDSLASILDRALKMVTNNNQKTQSVQKRPWEDIRWKQVHGEPFQWVS